MRLSQTVFPRLLCVVPALLCVLVTSGCQRTARDLPLDKAAARQSLTAFLDCWVEGKPVETLQSRTPAITGRDSDWDNGRKLVSYTIGAETDDGTNMHITAKLVLGSEGGEEPPLDVTYIVGTSPVITIFRDEL